MSHTYIIKNCGGNFWTGSKWSKEYPDAKLFDTEDEAISLMDNKREEKAQGFMSAVVWRDYGFDNEMEVAS